MLGVVRFWLDLGIDGFRLDAVPYLYKAEGTSCENLPATHKLLRRIRAEIDASYPNRILLAEVNQWPDVVTEYFGDGDECHMCFNFPLMPRMFMAVRREQRFPITEILAQTPPIPDGCQWGIFLRNHDELTLEMVTDEERDYMYSEYAHDPRMRRNLGIRRRLAPLVDNDRRVAELLYGLLLSLPGSPVLYYGDELLMGDNIYLGDRDGVRTPMQWSPDRNAGFSRADFAQLYLPPLMDPVHGYQAVNVEAEQRDPSSFLHWMRRMLAVRHQYPQFATGSLEVLPADNPSVLAYVRQATCPARSLAGEPCGGVVRVELESFRPAGRAQPRPLGGLHADRAVGTGALPTGHSWAVLGHAGVPTASTGSSSWSAESASQSVSARRARRPLSPAPALVPGRHGTLRPRRVGHLPGSPTSRSCSTGARGLASVVVTVGERRFHVLVGWREAALAPAVLGDHQGAVLGMCDDGSGDVLCYDALADEELSTGFACRGERRARERKAGAPCPVAREPRLARVRRAPVHEVLPGPRARAPARDRAHAQAGRGRLQASLEAGRPLGAKRVGPGTCPRVHPGCRGGPLARTDVSARPARPKRRRGAAAT